MIYCDLTAAASRRPTSSSFVLYRSQQPLAVFCGLRTTARVVPTARRRLLRIVRNSLWLSLTHYAAPPFPQKSRSARLFGCKRPHNGSLSLPTFAVCGQGRALSLRYDLYFTPCEAPTSFHSSLFSLFCPSGLLPLPYRVKVICEITIPPNCLSATHLLLHKGGCYTLQSTVINVFRHSTIHRLLY